MSTIKFWAAALLLALGLPQFSAAAESRGSFDDHQKIMGVLKQYLVALDSSDADLYVSTFLPEGATFLIRDVTRTGRAEIRKEVTGDPVASSAAPKDATAAASPPKPVAWHFMSNSNITFTSARSARHHAYYQVWTRQNDQPGGIARLTTPITLVGIGRYDDELVKVGDRWFIKNRKVTPDTSGGF